MLSIISRAEAKARGLTRFFTGRPCDRGHVAERTVLRKTCVECIPLNKADTPDAGHPSSDLSITKPTHERRNHGSIERFKKLIVDVHGRRRFDATIVDINGVRGTPYHCVPLLEDLERREEITPDMRKAGDKFHDDFRLANLYQLRASDIESVRVSGKLRNYEYNKDARDAIHRSIQLLGGHHSRETSCAWHILGCETSIRQWTAIRHNCGDFIGARLARKTLVTTLKSLV